MPDSKQIITKLTPLAGALAAFDRLATPVAARDVAIADAADGVLAADVRAANRPTRPTALHDGWAVAAADVADASGYAPVPLPRVPARVEIGDELPSAADAVLPPDAVVVHGANAEAIGTVAPGEGVLAPGGDIDAAKPLFAAGHRLRRVDLAVLAAVDVANVSLRSPRVIVAAAREDLRLVPAAQFIARDCGARGGMPQLCNGIDVEAALTARDADAVVIVGGTGSGARDGSVTTLARIGRVAAHGVGIRPGETTAFGDVDGTPVLIVPGRLDAALAAWLLVGRHMLARLSGHGEETIASPYRLTRKVTSTVGLCEFVPVRCVDGTAVPLAGHYLPLSALALANGYIVVPAESEGHAAGAEVAVHDWP
ncbi:MAG: molybdopterin-binding protein [Rhizobiaceae bacterium]